MPGHPAQRNDDQGDGADRRAAPSRDATCSTRPGRSRPARHIPPTGASRESGRDRPGSAARVPRLHAPPLHTQPGQPSAPRARSLVRTPVRAVARRRPALVAAAAGHHGRVRRGPRDLLRAAAGALARGARRGDTGARQRAGDRLDGVPREPADGRARVLPRLSRRLPRAGRAAGRIQFALSWDWLQNGLGPMWKPFLPAAGSARSPQACWAGSCSSCCGAGR